MKTRKYFSWKEKWNCLYFIKKLSGWADDKYMNAPEGSFSEKFYDKLGDHSDKVIEAGLAVALISGTLGVQKLIKVGKEKGFFTKDFWINKK